MNYKSNYGGILQCLALQSVIQEMGHDVDIIRFEYLQKDLRSRLRSLFIGSPQKILGLINGICYSILCKIREKRYPLSKRLLCRNEEFISNNIHYTELCNEETIGTLVEKNNYDVIIIGSDKIWGAVSRSQLVYFGEWDPIYKGKFVSYAACSSQKKIPKFNDKKIGGLLKKFSGVSVRDKHTLSLISHYENLNPKLVLDPTFLYNFPNLVNMDNPDTEPYILTYILGREISGGHNMMLEKIKKEIGNCKVKSIVLTNQTTDIVRYSDEVIFDATPVEWINLIKNSLFVYTDSFHGAVFSLKFGKNFIAYYRERNRASRLIDLGEQFGIQNCICASAQEADVNVAISALRYDLIIKEIEKEKQKSLEFLSNAISS